METEFATKADLADVKDELKGDIRGLGVVVERIDSNVRLLAEALTSTREQLERRIDAVEHTMLARTKDLADAIRHVVDRAEAFETSVMSRLDGIDLAIRKNSEDIRKNSEDIRNNSEDIRNNSEDIRKNSEDITHLQRDVRELRKAYISGERLDVLETRVSELEDRVGIKRG